MYKRTCRLRNVLVRAGAVAVMGSILAGALALASAPAEWPTPGSLEGSIAYTRSNSSGGVAGFDVFVADADGDNEVQVTRTDDLAVYGNTRGEDYPRWSPDGSEIAFTSANRDGIISIWRVPVAGGTPTAMVQNDGEAGHPDWHPSGDCIVYSGAHEGQGLSTLDLKEVCPGDSSRTILKSDDRDEAAPDWSPDGTTIVYQSREAPEGDMDDPDWSLYVVSSNGSDPQPLLEADEGTSFYYPRWSPDGGSVLYYAREKRFMDGEVRVLDVTTEQVTPLAQLASGPCSWSPDGNHIVYHNADRGGPRIVGDTSAMSGRSDDAQFLGLFVIDLRERTLYRLLGAAGGADANPSSFEWGYAPDWWAEPQVSPSPTPTSTPSSTPHASATASPTTRSSPTPTESQTSTVYLPRLLRSDG